MNTSNVRHLRRVSPPLASYFRVGHRDAALVTKLLEQGLPAGAGVIVDHAARKRTADLRDAAVENGVEVILDPRSVELSTIDGMAGKDRGATALGSPVAPDSDLVVRCGRRRVE